MASRSNQSAPVTLSLAGLRLTVSHGADGDEQLLIESGFNRADGSWNAYLFELSDVEGLTGLCKRALLLLEESHRRTSN